MFFTRSGLPEEDELVLCTVTKIQYHSVSCSLDEYGKTGMIHISEVSPGRIRNIRGYVVEGKKIVCKVLNINREKGYIDLSLRRVNEAQRRLKLDEIKQEQKAEKIVESLAKELEIEPKTLYEKIAPPLVREYGMLHRAFIDIVENDADIASLIDKKYAEPLTRNVKEKIPPKKVTIGADASLACYAEGGVELIRETLNEARKRVEGMDVRYRGGGTWHFEIEAKDYKSAERLLEQAHESLKPIEKKQGSLTFKRIK